MSCSALEAALGQQLALMARAEGWPVPETEFRFDSCCGHDKKEHGRLWGGLCYQCYGQHEYRAGRRWRADFAWPARKLLVEVEGGLYTGGRHVRGKGYEADLAKHNAAVSQGWTLLRFSRAQIESGEALNLIARALEGEP